MSSPELFVCAVLIILSTDEHLASKNAGEQTNYKQYGGNKRLDVTTHFDVREEVARVCEIYDTLPWVRKLNVSERQQNLPVQCAIE